MLDVDKKAKRREIMERYAKDISVYRKMMFAAIEDAKYDFCAVRSRLQKNRDAALARLDKEPRLP